MSQSNFIFGVLLIAYIVFITVRGELAAYIELLKGNGAVNQSGSGNQVSSGIGGAFNSIVSQLQQSQTAQTTSAFSLEGSSAGNALFPGGG